MLSAHDLNLSYGDRELFTDLKLTILAQERIALVGQNGAGKSSLLNILAGQEKDAGIIQISPHTKRALLTQTPNIDPDLSVKEIIKLAMIEHFNLIKYYKQLCQDLSQAIPQKAQNIQDKLSLVITQIEHAGGFDLEHHAEKILSRLGVKTREQKIKTLSGGEQRRVDLARTLLGTPDIYLLDEPTNHLDISAINYLAEFLINSNSGILFISHDRAFIDSVATKIIELDKGKIYTHEPPFANYLDKRLVRELINKKTIHKRERLLVQELNWLRAGTPARTTKQNARIERAYDLMDQVTQDLETKKQNKLNLDTNKNPRLGKTILELENIGAGFNNRLLFDNFSLKACGQQRYGILGKNGVGKTTLLNFIKKSNTPNLGKIKFGKNTLVASFDQHREALNPQASLKETLVDQGDFVFIGERKIHIASYLEEYLFDPRDSRRKVKTLSGGEQNRLMLAKLFKTPANCLLLDEPTNDLDAESLSVLEDMLLNYPGVVFCVSHDRGFLDRICTFIITFEPNLISNTPESNIILYPGNYTDYINLKAQAEKNLDKNIKAELKLTKEPKQKRKREKVKRSFKEGQELQNIEAKILEHETKKDKLTQELSSPDFFRQQPEKIKSYTEQIKNLEKLIEKFYTRWQELLDIEKD